MKVCIHRGTKEIGGTCIEVEAEGKRIVLDVGLPLDAGITNIRKSLLPKVSGFESPDPTLLGVVISHPHQDHYGLVKYLNHDIPILIGNAAHRILNVAKLFTPSGVAFKNTISLKDRSPLQIGPFTITPYLMDHSAYDAYSLLIESGGERLFYSGDFRGHGRKAGLFEKFISDPPQNVDVLLMEGTNIGKGEHNESKSEDALVEEYSKHLECSKGICLVWVSGQNIDRLVTLFKACRKAGRQLIIDLYTAEILRATGNERLPQGYWKGIRVYLPESQKRSVKRLKAFDTVAHYKNSRIYKDNLKEAASQWVFLFRPSMCEELESAGCLEEATMIYSLWPGYLKMEEQKIFLEWLDRLNIQMQVIHTSGHASLPDLIRFAEAIKPRQLVPIHSFASEAYHNHFDKVSQKEDGVWWEV